MAGYYGSMSVVLKNNKTLLGEKKRNTRKEYLNIKEVATDDPNKASSELLNEIRSKIQKENKKRKKTQIVIAILSLVITILVIYAMTRIEWVGIRVITQ
ncbi:hypothetical protein FIA58_005825 [Flavobacterium jejuense]|uniref:Uncharacterized protein n=1 Tax=Flavobacterium jejuense TaxID=1544455 RepID=A0ABX0INB1_9FLAO|nr:hypothetical protein [Flavobacterium jejuense]NHN25193.1 hypothetical protein [Flavobacterium jejuense]